MARLQGGVQPGAHSQPGLLPEVVPFQLHSSAKGCTPSEMQVPQEGRAQTSFRSAEVSDPTLRAEFERNIQPYGP